MMEPTRISTRRHFGTRRLTAALLAAAALGVCSAAPPGPPSGYDERRVPYLEHGLRAMRRLGGKIEVDPGRYAAGALAAAALAAQGGSAPGTAELAARWVERAIAGCERGWVNVDCERAQIALQRIALQYPEALPPALLPRLRAAASAGAPPPGPEAIARPWGFKETENQRILKTARSLVAEVVAGRPDSPAAKAWGDYARAFLLAHDRDGWYEADSPGYLGLSITSLLQIADHAPRPELRELAARQLNLLFAAWAQEQVAGFPAGAKSRTYVHWALGAVNTPWAAWAWLAAGIGDPGRTSFKDYPELAVSDYRIPAPVVRVLAGRRRQPPYEVRQRRRFDLAHRRDVDAALYSWATPDYILSAAQTVDGLRLGVSGGQEILATLYAEEAGFAPLYLWSRVRNPRSQRWRSMAGDDLAVADRNVLLARLGVGPGNVGHAYLSAPWSEPERLTEEVLAARCGDTYVALTTAGGWELTPAAMRFPEYYGGDRAFRTAWVAVPRRQPADVALEAGRRAEHGDFEAWKRLVASRARLAVARGGALRYTATDGRRLAFLPGQWAEVEGARLKARDYPLLDGPFVGSREPGRWWFAFGPIRVRLDDPSRTGKKRGRVRAPSPFSAPSGRSY